jgi:hypothetical protein
MKVMSAEEMRFVAEAAKFFEDPSLFTRTLSTAGNVIEGGIEKLPTKWKEAALNATNNALKQCLRFAIWSTKTDAEIQSITAANSKSSKSTAAHSAIAAITGGVSGFFGGEAIIVELPMTTSLLMRSIAKTANQFGHNTNEPEIFLECLYVFTLGGPGSGDDANNSAYISSRIAFNTLVREVLNATASQSAKELINAIQKGTAPVLAKLIATIAEQFGIRVTEKLIVQMAPIVGAAGGAGLNVMFNQYFSTAAKYHFGIIRLEKEYGVIEVQKSYSSQAARWKQVHEKVS